MSSFGRCQPRRWLGVTAPATATNATARKTPLFMSDCLLVAVAGHHLYAVLPLLPPQADYQPRQAERNRDTIWLHLTSFRSLVGLLLGYQERQVLTVNSPYLYPH
jgi:hypothetical protein